MVSEDEHEETSAQGAGATRALAPSALPRTALPRPATAPVPAAMGPGRRAGPVGLVEDAVQKSGPPPRIAKRCQHRARCTGVWHDTRRARAPSRSRHRRHALVEQNSGPVYSSPGPTATLQQSGGAEGRVAALRRRGIAILTAPRSARIHKVLERGMRLDGRTRWTHCRVGHPGGICPIPATCFRRSSARHSGLVLVSHLYLGILAASSNNASGDELSPDGRTTRAAR